MFDLCSLANGIIYIYIYILPYILYLLPYIFYICIYCHKYLYTSSSSSSGRAASTDIPDPLSPLLPIVHRFWQVFKATSRILTELLYVCSSWSSCSCSATWGGPWEYITWARPWSFSSVLHVCSTSIVFVMGGKWPYSWFFVGCCLHVLFNIARSILV